jgi:hypothetical protein
MYVLVSGRTLSINFVERLVKGARVCGVQLIPRGKLYSRRQASAEVELWLAPAVSALSPSPPLPLPPPSPRIRASSQFRN